VVKIAPAPVSPPNAFNLSKDYTRFFLLKNMPLGVAARQHPQLEKHIECGKTESVKFQNNLR
jgi:hypothetical protein